MTNVTPEQATFLRAVAAMAPSVLIKLLEANPTASPEELSARAIAIVHQYMKDLGEYVNGESKATAKPARATH